MTAGAVLSAVKLAFIGFVEFPLHLFAFEFEYAVAVTVCTPSVGADGAVNVNVHDVRAVAES